MEVRARNSIRVLSLAAVAAVLSGCITAHKVRIGYTPEPAAAPGGASKPYSLVVTDQRPYVTHGQKVPFYLGKVRSGLGDPQDVINDKKVALADQMKGDLRSELSTLGLLESTSPAAPQLVVRIHEWNFDFGVNGRFWYDIEIAVLSAGGTTLASNRVKDEKVMRAMNLFTGGLPFVKKEMPLRYAELIRKLVRDNPSVVVALQAGH